MVRPSLRHPLSEGAGRKMKQILIVDDDVHIGDMIEEMLTRRGYGVLRAYSGTEALLILAGKRPDLILLDLMLPGVTGEEVLSQIRGIPVIVISGKAEERSWPPGSKSGCAARRDRNRGQIPD